MRILFAISGERSHVLAAVPLAWAACAAGHEVHVAGTRQICPTIEASGLTAVAVGENHPIQEFIRSQGAQAEAPAADWSEPFADAQTVESLVEKYAAAVPYGFAPFSDNIVDGLTRYALHWRPNVVVWDALCYAGSVAARAVGAASFRLLWTVDIYSAMRELFVDKRGRCADPSAVPDLLSEWLGRHLDSVGASFDESALTGHVTVDQIPDCVQISTAVRRQPVRYVSSNGGSTLPGWLSEPPTTRRVAITGGISFDTGVGGDHLSMDKLLLLCADLPIEIVVAGHTEVDPTTLPHNVRAVDFVAMNALLPTCDAVVHHGGFGTWGTAALLAVPQLILPIRHGDLWIRATRTASVGAASVVHPAETTESEVADAVVALLADPAPVEGAATLAASMATCTAPADAVSEWPEMVAAVR